MSDSLSAFDVAIDEVGEIMDGLQPFFTKAGGWVSDFTGAVVDEVGQIGGELFDAFDDAITGGDWGGLGSAIGQAIMDALEGAVGIGAQLTTWFAELFAGIDWFEVGKTIGATIIPLVVGIITTLIDGLFTLLREHFVETVLAVFSLIPIGRFSTALGKLLSKIPFLKVLAPLARGLGRAGEVVERVVGFIWRNTFGALFKAFGQVIDIGMPGIITRIVDWFKLLPTRIGLIGIEIVDAVKGWFSLVGAWLGTNAQRFIIQPLSRLGGMVARALGGAARWLVDRGRQIIRGLLRGIGSAASGIGGFLNRNVVQPVLRFLGRFFGPMVSRGREIISGLLSGVRGALGNLIGFVASTPGACSVLLPRSVAWCSLEVERSFEVSSKGRLESSATCSASSARSPAAS